MFFETLGWKGFAVHLDGGAFLQATDTGSVVVVLSPFQPKRTFSTDHLAGRLGAAYAQWMNKTPSSPIMRLRGALLLALLLLAMPLALAQVYRSIGPDGRPVFSDRPPADAPAEVLPEFAPRPEPAQAPTAALPTEAERAAGFRGSYDAFEMLTPADNAELRNGDQAVDVSLLLVPPIKPGHRLSIEVDGVPASGDGGSMQFTLKGLGLGSHRLQALVVDDAGVPAAATPTVHVHIRPALPDNALP